MALTQGGFQAYDFNRMVVLFTMMNDKTEVSCAISTDAIDRSKDRPGSLRSSANSSSCGCATASRNAHRGNSSMSSSRAIRPA